MHESKRIAAIVAAAGMSTRMGRPKQLLPWGGSTVIRTVTDSLRAAGAEPILVVVGHRADEVAEALEGSDVQTVYNPDYAASGLLQSFQAGLRKLSDSHNILGVLLCLGDQPHVDERTLRQLTDYAKASHDKLVIPSYGGRRGHPIYLPARLMEEVVSLGEDETLRTVVVGHESDIAYVDVDSPDILSDIDTPSDYSALKPE